MVAKQVNKKNAGKPLACEPQTFLLAHRRETSLNGDERGETSAVRRLANHVFWRLILFYTRLLLLLQPSVLWLSNSIVTFSNAKLPPKLILREFDVSRILSRLGGLPHLETFTWQNMILAERVTRSGRPGYPPWRVTPPIM